MNARRSLALVSIALLAACSKSDVDSAQNAVASSVPVLANEAGITARIEARFAEIDPSSAFHVTVGVHGGEVKLAGKVRDAKIDARFVAAANGVSGVKHVTSTLAIDPSLPNTKDSFSDFVLEASVRAKLVEQAGVNGVHVVVTARAGAVTLSGDVPTRDVANTLVAAAKTVKGVKNVESKLAVHA